MTYTVFYFDINYKLNCFFLSDTLSTFFQSVVVFVSWLTDTKCKPCCQKCKIEAKVITEEEMNDLLAADSIGRGDENSGSLHKIKSQVITREEMVDLLGDSIGRDDDENSGSLLP